MTITRRCIGIITFNIASTSKEYIMKHAAYITLLPSLLFLMRKEEKNIHFGPSLLKPLPAFVD